MEEVVWIDKENDCKIIKSEGLLYLFIEREGYTAQLPIKSKEEFYNYYRIWGFTLPKEKEQSKSEKLF